MSKILVAVDFSSLTPRTIDYATRLAVGPGYTIDLLHVVLATLPANVRAHAPKEVLEKIVSSEESQGNAKLNAAMQEHVPQAVRGEALLRRGKAAETICQVAAEGYELLVVSTQGRTGFQHMLMGSVAERVVRMAPIPVLVVR